MLFIEILQFLPEKPSQNPTVRRVQLVLLVRCHNFLQLGKGCKPNQGVATIHSADGVIFGFIVALLRARGSFHEVLPLEPKQYLLPLIQHYLREKLDLPSKLQQFQHIQLIVNLFLAFRVHFVSFDLISLSAADALCDIVEDIFDCVYKALPVDQIEKDPMDIGVIQGVFLLQRIFNAVAIAQIIVSYLRDRIHGLGLRRRSIIILCVIVVF